MGDKMKLSKLKLFRSKIEILYTFFSSHAVLKLFSTNKVESVEIFLEVFSSIFDVAWVEG